MNLHFPHRPHKPPAPETLPMPLYPHAGVAAKPRHRHPDWVPTIVCAVTVLLIAVISVGVVLNDTPAQSSADRAAVISPTSAGHGVPVARRSKPVEYSPVVGDYVPGNGTWIIGKEIKRGTYRTEGGTWCFWERLRDLSGEAEGVMSKGFVKGPQYVAMGPDDVAFSTQGCGPWVKIP